MPKKTLPTASAPILVTERLQVWGRCIQVQRSVQRVTAAELARRSGVSLATLKRIETGDPGVAAVSYLTALAALAMLDTLVPPAPAWLQTAPVGMRVRLSRRERGSSADPATSLEQGGGTRHDDPDWF